MISCAECKYRRSVFDYTEQFICVCKESAEYVFCNDKNSNNDCKDFEKNGVKMIAVGMISCDRYYHVASTLLSLQNAKIKDPYYIIVDDNSSKKVLDLYKDFSAGKSVQVITREKRRGLPGLADAFSEIVNQAKSKGCEYLFLVPDDIVVNRYLGECIEKAKGMLNDDICAIQFFRDSRGSVFRSDSVKEYNEHFHIIGGVDGFAVLMRTDYAITLDWTVDQEDADKRGRSLIWQKIAQLMNTKTILEVNESLVEHTGNFYNATLLKEKRNEKKIWAVELNMFRRPKWLG